MKLRRKAAPEAQTVPDRQEMPLLQPSAEKGLTSSQARALAEAGWDNRPVESPTKSDKQIIRENILTYFNLIFAVLAVCLALVGDWKDMTFLVIVAANAGIGIVQQLRSKRTIERLTLLAAAKVRTVRDGAVKELPTSALVREDVVELTASATEVSRNSPSGIMPISAATVDTTDCRSPSPGGQEGRRPRQGGDGPVPGPGDPVHRRAADPHWRRAVL